VPVAKVQSALPAARPLIPYSNCERAGDGVRIYITTATESSNSNAELDALIMLWLALGFTPARKAELA
jgi:hypothetical protein